MIQKLYLPSHKAAVIYFLKVKNRNTRTICKICSKLTIKTSERNEVSIDNYDQVNPVPNMFISLNSLLSLQMINHDLVVLYAIYKNCLIKLQSITDKLKTSLTKEMKNVTKTKNQKKSPYPWPTQYRVCIENVLGRPCLT